jgi:Ca-activated chloride channel homolog
VRALPAIAATILLAAGPLAARRPLPAPAPAQAPANAQAAPGAPAIRITAPENDTYVTGRVVLTAAIDPAGAAVDRISFYADGRLVCAVDRPPFTCPWDAGPGVKEHVIRAVAQLPGGGRAVTSVRTRGAGIAEAVEVHVVQVSVLVRDDKGGFVKDLEARDFRLREDDVPQRLTHVANQDTPLEVVMALDISASMAGAIDDVRTSARTFISALRERDALTILGFNDNIFTVARRETQAETRLRALDRLAPWGSTSLYDVISRGVSLLRQQAGRKGLVVFSDGEDESSRLSFDVVEKELQSSDAVMYAVGLGRGARMADLTRQLSRLADASGGRVVIAPDTSQLSGAFSDVVDELSHQYVLSYAPTNDKRDGTWRALTVEVPGRDVRIRARQGYRAMGAKP